MTPDTWTTSTRCSSGGCIAVRPDGGEGGNVAVRDTKHDGGPVLTFSFEAWTAFIDAVKGSGL